MNRKYPHEPHLLVPASNASYLTPIIEIAATSPFGYRLRVDGREVGPKIGTLATAEYLQSWLENAWEEIHRG